MRIKKIRSPSAREDSEKNNEKRKSNSEGNHVKEEINKNNV
jgi:hypothetical protein